MPRGNTHHFAIYPVPEDVAPGVLAAELALYVGEVEELWIGGRFARILFVRGQGGRALEFCEFQVRPKLTTVHRASIDGGMSSYPLLVKLIPERLYAWTLPASPRGDRGNRRGIWASLPSSVRAEPRPLSRPERLPVGSSAGDEQTRDVHSFDSERLARVQAALAKTQRLFLAAQREGVARGGSRM